MIRNRTLYTAPTSDRPPPAWIRGLLILTCTGVSFAHGSNDGQKGMGLIMLILIGSVPTAFALNHAMPSSATPAFYQATERAQAVFAAHAAGATVPSVAAARTAVTEAVQQRQIAGPQTWAALDTLSGDIAAQVRATWRNERNSRRRRAERAQRHVSGQRGDPSGAEDRTCPHRTPRR